MFRRLLAAGLLLAPVGLSGSEPLRMQVSPALTKAPALLTVRVSLDARADDRMLQVVAESASFYRSSEVALDGDHALRLQVFEFKNVPTGTYQITGVLVGTHGARATVSRIARVEPSAGSR